MGIVAHKAEVGASARGVDARCTTRPTIAQQPHAASWCGDIGRLAASQVDESTEVSIRLVEENTPWRGHVEVVDRDDSSPRLGAADLRRRVSQPRRPSLRSGSPLRSTTRTLTVRPRWSRQVQKLVSKFAPPLRDIDHFVSVAADKAERSGQSVHRKLIVRQCDSSSAIFGSHAAQHRIAKPPPCSACRHKHDTPARQAGQCETAAVVIAFTRRDLFHESRAICIVPERA